MAEITKQDVKEIIVGALEPFAKAVQGDFQEIKTQLTSVEGRLTSVEDRLTSVDGRLSVVESELKEFRENASELFAKLDKFITLYEKQELETRSLANQMARLEERVSRLETK